eukprot:scaffold64031_cov50-Attheya_sp.AAC.2
MRFHANSIASLLASVSLWNALSTVQAFSIAPPLAHRSSVSFVRTVVPSSRTTTRLFGTGDAEDEEEEDKPMNPYADPNYPDLEFVNYDDPEYSVDQGEEVFSVEEEVEEMREDRRRRNDEYQFETYHAKMLQNGEGSFNGEWTTYYTTTFLPGRATEVDAVNGLPRLVKDQRIRRVISSGKKIPFETDSTWRVDSERLIHEERMVPFDDNNDDDDTDEDVNSEYAHMDEELVGNPYWPAQMSSKDFRGEQGNMCVGGAYTICDSMPLSKEATDAISSHEGPFSELRTEVGVQYENTRFRVKLDYRALPEDVGATVPALGLKSMTICRETQTVWPSDVASLESMFYGPPGA